MAKFQVTIDPGPECHIPKRRIEPLKMFTGPMVCPFGKETKIPGSRNPQSDNPRDMDSQAVVQFIEGQATVEAESIEVVRAFFTVQGGYKVKALGGPVGAVEGPKPPEDNPKPGKSGPKPPK